MITADVTYHVIEKVSDPYDLFNSFEKDFDHHGKPFYITGHWSTRIDAVVRRHQK